MNGIIIKIGKDKYKVLNVNQYMTDRNTPIGDPADYYEKKPFGGLKQVEPLAFINNGKIEYYKYQVFDYSKKDWVLSKNTPASFLDFCNNLVNKSVV